MRHGVAVLAGFSLAAAAVFFVGRISSQITPTADFTHYESAHVHPAALSPGGDRLFVVNTPDMRLSVFSLAGGTPVLEKEIPVGLEPVSVAALSDDEVWVVNHLSDDVSVVDVSAGNVIRTIPIGDEPTDVVFAGSGAGRRAFVCVSQEDAVKVIDPASPGTAPEIIPIAGSDPRALAVDGTGSQVYVTVLESGNQTTLVGFQEVIAGGGPPPPNPPMDSGLPPAPDVGLIVKWDGTAWRDEIGRNWNPVTPHRLADKDLIVIDVASRSVSREVKSVGTVNFNAAWNPGNGLVYVTNQDARNPVRFEPNLQGNFERNRVTIVDPVSGVVNQEVHLNPHIDYSVIPGPQSEISRSLAIPTDIAWNATGDSGYVAAMGSDLVGLIDAAGNVLRRIAVGGGPSGLVLDPDRGALYVVNRFDNSVSVVELGSLAETAVIAIGRSGFDPTPPNVKEGRRFHYDARLTSAHGDVACASCHVFANFDALSWDLGNPRGEFLGTDHPDFPPGMLDPNLEGFHPMKGPMLTQSLRGLASTPPFHWRGDRLTFETFNGAFVSLLGNDRELTGPEMVLYKSFILSIDYPPNPNQNLDRSFPDAPPGQPSAERGRLSYLNDPHAGPLTCNNCHLLPTGTNGQIINDQALQEDQDLLVPHTRNLYEKVGFTDGPVTDNKLGFAYTHDGVIDNLFSFLSLPVFQFDGGDPQRRDVEAFLLAFDTGTAPIVGFQVTLSGSNKNEADILALLDLLRTRAMAGDGGVIVKGVVAGEQRGFALDGNGSFLSDRQSEGAFTIEDLRSLATDGGELTFTGVPVGSANRAGIDRDRDGWRDRDELDAGADPADPDSHPDLIAVSPPTPRAARFAGASPNPFLGSTRLRFELSRPGPVRLAIYDPRGRLIRVLANSRYPAGSHAVLFDGRDRNGARLAAGLYLTSFDTGDRRETRRVVVLK